MAGLGRVKEEAKTPQSVEANNGRTSGSFGNSPEIIGNSVMV
jgi:hypothetical protein